MRRRNVKAGKITFWVEQEGKGAPLVVIHGGPGVNHQYFHPHLGLLAEFCEVVYYDLRGQGGSSPAPQEEDYGLLQDVEDVEKLRQSLGLEKIHLLGHSYGGYVALEYATQYAEHTRTAILCSVPIGESEEEINRRSDEIWNSLQRLYPGEDIFYRFYFRKPVSEKTRYYNDVVRKDYAHPQTRKVLEAYAKDTYMVHPYLALSLIPCPIYLLYGRHDPLCNIELIQNLSEQYPRTRLILFEESGHDPFADEPEYFARVMKKIISGC
ncbi:MAG: alpha/beta fold hydrolase [bacterium]